jgi:hypothetical protein
MSGCFPGRRIEMAELNIKGIKSGGAFWYAPWPNYFNKPVMPVKKEGLPIVKISGDLFFIDADGDKIWPHTVHATQEAANKILADMCGSEIRTCQSQIDACNIMLAKLQASGTPQPDDTDTSAPFENTLTPEDRPND